MWPKSLSVQFSSNDNKKNSQSMIDLNKTQNSPQNPDYSTSTISFQRIKQKVKEKIQEKYETVSSRNVTSPTPGEEEKRENVEFLIMMRKKVPAFLSLANPKPEDFPNPLQMSAYLRKEFAQNPKTISYCWLPIESLKNEGKFNKTFKKNIDSLKSKHAAWRKVRGDGNCYYRSVISNYLLKIFHPSTSPLYYQSFMQKLASHISESEPLQSLFNTLNSLLSKYQNQNSSALYLEIEKMLQDCEFDKWLIKTARYFTEVAVNNFSELTNFVEDSDKSNIISNIRTMGNEAEGVELYLLPTALGIVVEQANLFDDVLYSEFPCKDQLKLSIQIISKSKGHYDMLLSNKDVEYQQYSVNELIFYHN